MHQHALFSAARRGGTRLAVVNPVRVGGCEGAEWFLRPRPGTDAALALAMMNVILAEERHDPAFLARHVEGFDALRTRVAEYPPERAAALTDLAAGDIRSFARFYAAHPPAFIYVGPGGLRHSNAGETLRAMTCLPALVGAWAFPAGGIHFPTSTAFPVDWQPLEGEDLRPIPPASYNMIHLGRLLDPDAPDCNNAVQSLYVFNGNPASVLYDQNRLRRGLSRDDLFTVVHERWLTDTARYADIVLPAGTSFEHLDLLFSYSHQTLLLNRPAIAPLGETRSTVETFAALAAGLGFSESSLSLSAPALLERALGLPEMAGIDRARLEREGWTPLPAPSLSERLARGIPLPTPSGRIEVFSHSLAAAGRDPLSTYVPSRESRDGSPEQYQRYPLTLLTPSGHAPLNSNFGNQPGRHRTERRPTLLISPEDAHRHGIEDGALVEIYNDRGHCQLWAHVTPAPRPGVVVAAGQWWDHLYPGTGTPNCTTPDFPADMGGGSAFNSNLVAVRPCRCVGTGGESESESTLREPPARLIHRGLGLVEFFDLAETDLPAFPDLIARMAAEGYPAFSCHAPLCRPVWFAHSGVTCFFLNEDPVRRQRSLAVLEDTLRQAHGAVHVVTHLTYGPTDTTDRAQAVRLAHQAADDMAALSRRHGIPIDVEFAAYSDAFHTAEDFAGVLADHPELKLCLDVGHAFIGARKRGRDFLADIAHLAPLARSAHVWNWRPGETGHVPVHPSQRTEEGWIPLPAVIALMIDGNPALRIIFEYPVKSVTPPIGLGYTWIESLIAAAGGGKESRGRGEGRASPMLGL